MDLILWRHAEAEAAQDPLRDLERALTSKGERQAQRMAHWLNHRITESTRVLVSPARRCQQTAAALGRSFRTLPGLSTDADVDEVLRLARWPDATDPVLVVGHQPTLGRLCARLLSGTEQPWHVKKAAVWWLRQREREGVSGVFLQAVQAPDGL